MSSSTTFAKLFVVHRFAKQIIKSKEFESRKKCFSPNEIILIKTLAKHGFNHFIKNEWNKWNKETKSQLSISKNTKTHSERKQDCDDYARYTNNDKTINNVIDMIIKYFGQEYSSIISYKKEMLKMNQLSFYHKLFNTRDLIINIFQYLQCISELNSCKMVDSIWLINSLDIHCTQYWALSSHRGVLPKLLAMRSNSTPFLYDYCYISRQWQRLTKVARLHFMCELSYEFINSMKWIPFSTMKEVVLTPFFKDDLNKQKQWMLLCQFITTLCSLYNNSTCTGKVTCDEKCFELYLTPRLFRSIPVMQLQDENSEYYFRKHVLNITKGRYTTVHLDNTIKVCSVIIGKSCTKLSIESCSISINNSNLNNVVNLTIDSDSMECEWNQPQLQCPKLRKLTLKLNKNSSCNNMLNLLKYWNMHKKYLTNNNATTKFCVYLNTVNEKNNSMYQMFQFIEQNKLSAQQTYVCICSPDEFLVTNQMFQTMNNFRNHIESLEILFGEYTLESIFGNNKISHLFFDKNGSQAKFTMSKLQMLKFDFCSKCACTVDTLLDVLLIISHQKQFNCVYDHTHFTKSIRNERNSSILTSIFGLNFLLPITANFDTTVTIVSDIFASIYKIMINDRYPIRFYIEFISDKDEEWIEKQVVGKNIDDVVAALSQVCKEWQDKFTKDCKLPKYHSFNHSADQTRHKKISFEAKMHKSNCNRNDIRKCKLVLYLYNYCNWD